MPPKKATAPKMVNVYSLKKVQAHMTKSINPHFKTHQIKVPFRGMIIGSSGAGKTNLLMNIIAQMPRTFNHIYIYTRSREPIYDFLLEELGRDVLTVSYDLNDLRSFDESQYYGQSLVIFDDMVNEKDQKSIQELFIRGRKIAGGVSLLYLTQSYFTVPKIIRQQTQYVFILKVSGVRDLKLIVSEYSLSASKEQLTNMYNFACNSGTFGNFFLIDLEAPQSRSYRKNFDEILSPADFL